MPEKTKRAESDKNCAAEKSEESFDRKITHEDSGKWSDDQQKKSYYYDDAHGYEVYNPDTDEDDENVAEKRLTDF